MSIFGVQIKVTHLNLCLGPSESCFAFENAGVVVLICQHHCVFARARNGRTKRNSSSLARPDANTASQTEHWIEYRPNGVRQRTIFHYCNWVGRCMASAQEAAAISFVLNGSQDVALGH